jgi:hypothetical protein
MENNVIKNKVELAVRSETGLKSFTNLMNDFLLVAQLLASYLLYLNNNVMGAVWIVLVLILFLVTRTACSR